MQFGSDTFSVTEGCVQADITVRRTGPTDATSVVSYSVADGTATQRGDFSGYFWLQKLNGFSQPGDDVRDDSAAQRRVQRAEMVRAFIESAEYRERFAGGANRGEQQGAGAQARPAGDGASPGALVEALLAARMIRMP